MLELLFASVCFFTASSLFATATFAAAHKAARDCLRPIAEREAGAVESSEQTLVVDGSFGRLTAMALQSLLVKIGIPTGPIDGIFGRRTVVGLQAMLRRLGYAAGPIDGRCGRRTVRALQTWLLDQCAHPGPADGSWGIRTTAALQRVLNALLAQGTEIVDATLVAGSDVGTDADGTPVTIVSGKPVTPRGAVPMGLAVPAGENSEAPLAMGTAVAASS